MRVLRHFLILISALALLLGGVFWSDVGTAQTPPPDQVGEWSDPFNFGPADPGPIAPIHMTVLPNGKVLAWNSPAGFIDEEHAGEGRDYTPAVLWDPVAGTFTQVRLDLDANPAEIEDLFCSGHALLINGKVFVAGGHALSRTGIKKAFTFDYTNNTWARILPDMADARWYPTNTLLNDGRMLVTSGTITPGVHNDRPEVYDPAPPGSWNRLPNPQARVQSNYPYMYLAANGLVFDAGEKSDASFLNPNTGEWSFVSNSGRVWQQASSVMYEPGKVLNTGGGVTDNLEDLRTTRRINFNTPTGWISAGPLNHGRRNHNSTILADGTVLVTGGAKCDVDISGCDLTNANNYVYVPELWSSAAPTTWTDMANMKVQRKRAYHSTAALLPDGRVVTAGGETMQRNPAGHFPDTAEFYSPPYLFKGQRPSITSAPTSVGYNQQFDITSNMAADITKVTWIRLSSVTHGFNQNQRINYLTFSHIDGGLRITSPVSALVSPPGHYMLFILNSRGVPSEAKVIRIQ